jgi:hypothetical protein
MTELENMITSWAEMMATAGEVASGRAEGFMVVATA